ncbi:MAG: ribosome small subunit-dependent GTPase A [Bacteroidetes bacterium]|nr:ribosome small subunit-dependent GTPase A [Bacteroidota bacterium]
MDGIVTRSTGNHYLIWLPHTQGFVVAQLAGKIRMHGLKHTNPVAVGDGVRLSNPIPGQPQTIEEIKDRKNYLIRTSTRLDKQTHILASNLDGLWVVASVLNPRTSTGFIDRILVTAEAYSIPACIVVNKSDLWVKHPDEADQFLAHFQGLPYPVFAVSAQTGEGIHPLEEWLLGKTTLVCGHSGVGKSTLINALKPDLSLRTGELSDKHQKGKHTTTFAEMLFLNSKTRIIDTPGIKEFGLYDIEDDQLGDFFPEIFRAKKGCRYSDCLHTNEPGCAVISEVAAGTIHADRFKNYLQMLESNHAEYRR